MSAAPSTLPPLCLPEEFAESWIHQPGHVVAGTPLRPFCLWHRMQFEAYGLPWGRPPLRGQAPALPTVRDLLAAVQICRTRYEEPPDFSPLALVRTRTIWGKLRLRRRLPRGQAGEMEAFTAYLLDFCAPPRLWQVKARTGLNEKAPMGSRPPSTLTVATALVRAHFGETRAWEMPEGMAHWYYTTGLWLDGEPIPFITESAAELEAHRRRKAAYQKAKAARKAKEKDSHA